MKLANVMKYLEENLLASQKEFTSNMELVQKSDFLMLNNHLSRLENSKVNVLVLEEVKDFLSKNPQLEKQELLNVLKEMLVGGTAYTQMDMTFAKRARLTAELLVTLSSNRF